MSAPVDVLVVMDAYVRLCERGLQAARESVMRADTASYHEQRLRDALDARRAIAKLLGTADEYQALVAQDGKSRSPRKMRLLAEVAADLRAAIKGCAP